MNALVQCSKDFTKIEKEQMAKMQHYTWKQLYNCGKDVSKGARARDDMLYLRLSILNLANLASNDKNFVR